MKKYKFNDESKVINLKLPTLKSLAKRKVTIQTFLGLVFIFFFFNFFTIKCNDTKLVSVTGINLVFGTNVSNQLDSNLSNLTGIKTFDEKGNIKETITKEEKDVAGVIPPNFFAVLAFITIILGFITHTLKFLYHNLVTLIVLGITFLSLIVVWLSFGTNLISHSSDMINITITVNIAYWLVLFFVLLSIYLCYLRCKYEV